MSLPVVPVSLPLEREFEAWLVRGIEDYFREVGVPATILAVSPHLERHWPADESLAVGGKVVGLQVKRPRAASSPQADVSWNLSNPPHQRDYIKARPELLYALPAFRDAALRRAALYHFYFWRPGKWPRSNMSNNISAEWVRGLTHAWEWGGFVRRIMDCKIGAPLGGRTLFEYIGELQADMRRSAREFTTGEEGEPDALYVLHVPVPT
jgi:hypothetical protein